MATPHFGVGGVGVIFVVVFVQSFLSFLPVHAWDEVSWVPRHENHNNNKQPNIVFIMADDLGYNDVGYHNPKGAYTPTIDKLAKEGVRLENYYVQPICSPTRSQFMSGRSQIHTGLQHKNIRRTQPAGLPLDSPTLADKLREAGYATDMVGKWHLGFYKNEYLPTSRGFDTFYGMYLGSGSHFKHKACARGCMVDLHNDTATRQTPDLNQSGVYSTHLYTNEAIRVIRHRTRTQDNNSKPFFLYLSYQAVHGPLQVPNKYRKVLKKKLKSKRMGGKSRQKFLAMGYALDVGIQRVVDALKDTGAWNNTILVFSTDNGATPKLGGSNSPLKGNKGFFYEGGVRAVGLVNSPLMHKPGYVNKEMMHVTDWFPTFVSLANGTLDGTRDVNGFDQWETISQRMPSPRDEILFNIDPKSKSKGRKSRRHPFSSKFNTRWTSALRKGDYKIITGTESKYGGISLYNVKSDPLEQFDLAPVKAYRPKVEELLDRLHAHQQTAVPVRFPPSERVRFDKVWGPWK